MRADELIDAELDLKCEKNEPEALFEKGRRSYNAGDIASAKKYFTFARLLGSYLACGFLGYIYEKEGDNKAEEAYRDGCRGGDVYSTFRYACIIMNDNFDEAIELLSANAVGGHALSAERLAKIYEKLGDTENSNYYASLAKTLKTKNITELK